jgi:uncharacterized protein YciI
MKYVLFYESADDVATKAPAHYPAHSERAARFHADGTLLMIGVFSNVQRDGAMGIFTTREAAEEFAQADPFVLKGVVRSWEVREWRESLG